MPHIYQKFMFKKISLKYYNKRKFIFEIMVLKFVCHQSYIHFCNKIKRIKSNVQCFCSNNGFY